MNRTFTIGTIWGSELRLHWSWPAFPIGVAVYCLITRSALEAAFHILLLLALHLSVLAHEGMQLFTARQFGIGTRDVTLYPFWGVGRLTYQSDRPWQEKYIAGIGPVCLGIIASIIGIAANISGSGLALPSEWQEATLESFLVHLFWANVLLAGLHLLPFIPLDGGRVLRAFLAMRTSRLRATELAAAVSTVGSGLFLAIAFAWLRSPLLGVLAMILYLGAQQELDATRFFASIRLSRADRLHQPTSIVPIDRVVAADCQPGEPNFTGLIWNASSRLWIEWRDGLPISANAIIGDRRK
jgi:Zn-dependent protease